MSDVTEIFRKTTGKGLVLIVGLIEGRPVSTVDGKLVCSGLVRYAPKTIAGKTVVAQLGAVALTAEELIAVEVAYGPAKEPPPVDPRFERAKSYSREDAAWDRGHELSRTGE